MSDGPDMMPFEQQVLDDLVAGVPRQRRRERLGRAGLTVAGVLLLVTTFGLRLFASTEDPQSLIAANPQSEEDAVGLVAEDDSDPQDLAELARPTPMPDADLDVTSTARGGRSAPVDSEGSADVDRSAVQGDAEPDAALDGGDEEPPPSPEPDTDEPDGDREQSEPAPAPEPPQTVDEDGEPRLEVRSIVVEIGGGNPRSVTAVVQVANARLCDGIVAVPVTSGDVRVLRHELEIGPTDVCRDGIRTINVPLGRLDPGPWRVQFDDVTEAFDVPVPDVDTEPDDTAREITADFVLEVTSSHNGGAPELRVGFTPNRPACLVSVGDGTHRMVAADSCPEPVPDGTQWYGPADGFPAQPVDAGYGFVVDGEPVSFEIPEPILLDISAIPAGTARYDADTGEVTGPLAVRAEGYVQSSCARVDDIVIVDRSEPSVVTRLLLDPKPDCRGVTTFDVTSSETIDDYQRAELLFAVNGYTMPGLAGEVEVPWGGPIINNAVITIDDVGDQRRITIPLPIQRTVPCSRVTVQDTPFGTAFTPGAPPQPGVWYVVETWYDQDINAAICPSMEQPSPVVVEYVVEGPGEWPVRVNDAERRIAVGQPDGCMINGEAVVSPLPSEQCTIIETMRDHDAGWAALPGWSSTTDPCTWHGIFCGPDQFYKFAVAGQGGASLPPEFNQLRSLSTVELVDLGLGQVPEQLRGLGLTHLRMQGNGLTVLPEWLLDETTIETLGVDSTTQVLPMLGLETLVLGELERDNTVDAWVEAIPHVGAVLMRAPSVEYVADVVQLDGWRCSADGREALVENIACQKSHRAQDCVLGLQIVPSAANAADCRALEALVDAVDVDLGAEWGTVSDPCGWTGVTCGSTGIIELAPVGYEDGLCLTSDDPTLTAWLTQVFPNWAECG